MEPTRETSKDGNNQPYRTAIRGRHHPPWDAMKLDGTSEATLARSALPAGERGWITFAEARTSFSTKGEQYAFGETDDDGRTSGGKRRLFLVSCASLRVASAKKVRALE